MSTALREIAGVVAVAAEVVAAEAVAAEAVVAEAAAEVASMGGLDAMMARAQLAQDLLTDQGHSDAPTARHPYAQMVPTCRRLQIPRATLVR